MMSKQKIMLIRHAEKPADGIKGVDLQGKENPEELIVQGWQREMLDGSVYLDPHPDAQNVMRTRDIRDPQHAKQFVRTQVAKHLEHYFASEGNRKVEASLSADNQPAGQSVSPARIDELRSSRKRKTKPGPRP
jgi:hypothetical protein